MRTTTTTMSNPLLIALIVHLIIGTPVYAQLPLSEPHAPLAQAITLMQQEKYENAQRCLETYLETHPHDLNAIEAQYYAALCALKCERPHGEALFHKFVQQHPQHCKAALAYYQLGNIYFSNHNFEKSIAYYLKVDQNKLDQATRTECQYQLAYAYMNEKNFDEALRHFNAIKDNENAYQYAASYYAGYIAYRKAHYDNALQDLQRAYTHSTYQPVVPYLVLQVYYKQKRFQELIQYIEEVKRKDIVLKNQDEIELLTAEAYFFLQKYVQAAHHYEEYLAHRDFSATSQVLYRLAFSLYQAEERHKALKYFKSLAIQEDAIGQQASYYVGLLYLKTQQKALAQVALKKASRADFSTTVQEAAALKYAKVSYDLGHFSNTIATLQAFKRNYPHSSHLVEVDALLSEAYLRTKDYDLAIAHIEQRPDSIADTAQIYQQVTFYKGSEYFNNGNYTQAIIHFRKSLQHTPNKHLGTSARLWLGESYSTQQNYDAAIAAYMQVLQQTTPQTSYYRRALYGAAYAHFNTGSYLQALTYFTQYVQQEKSPDWLRDARVRMADCHYIAKDYPRALDLYRQVRSHYPAHVAYQEGKIHSLQGNLQEAQNSFQNVLDMHAHTAYYEKALFEKAHLILTQGDYKQAKQAYTTFIQQKPHSQLLPDALLQRAIAHVNLQEYDQAIENYALLLKDYPTHTNAQSALLELPKILRMQGKSEAFTQYLNTYKAANPDTPALEQLTFDNAKALFYEPSYLPAIEQLSNFLETYPKSSLAAEARFLIAEAYYRLKEPFQAQAHYQQTLQDRTSPFYSKVLLRLATLHYQQKSFAQALQYFEALQEAARNKKETYYALEGIMRTSHALQQYDKVDQSATRIIAQGNLAVNATNEALLFLSKSAIQRKDHTKAMKHLQQLTQSGKDKYAAEGQYLLAMLHYEAGKHTQSLEALFVLNQRFPIYKDWTSKGFLLIADNYIALKDNFQATATLQSIIENAEDPSVVEAAKAKLDKLPQQAPENVKIEEKELPPPAEDKEFRTLDE